MPSPRDIAELDAKDLSEIVSLIEHHGADRAAARCPVGIRAVYSPPRRLRTTCPQRCEERTDPFEHSPRSGYAVSWPAEKPTPRHHRSAALRQLGLHGHQHRPDSQLGRPRRIKRFPHPCVHAMPVRAGRYGRTPDHKSRETRELADKSMC